MPIPDYYKILNVQPNANEAEIRQAYKKQSLQHHPDRLHNATEKERVAATEKFQTVADAYYVLSDSSRRRAYDAQRPSGRYGAGSGFSGFGGGATAAEEQQEEASGSFPGGFGFDNSDSASANFFRQFFGKGGSGAAFADEDAESSADSNDARPNAEQTFSDVFEDLLKPEVERVVPVWRFAGAGAGAVMGFIVGNLPGMAVGAYAGGKVGSIRDAKGKAVATVFKELGGDQRAQILQALFAKVIGQATGR